MATQPNRLPSASVDLGLLLIRAMVGVVLTYHGSQKLFGAFGGSGLGGFAGYLQTLNVPLPQVSAVLAACAEFFGGLAFVSGVGVRLTAGPVAFTMIVACVTAHWGRFGLQNGGMEYALTLGVIAVGLALTGPGKWTLAAFGRKAT